MQKVRVFLNASASSSSSRDWSREIGQVLFRSQVDFVAPKSGVQMRKELKKAAEEKIDVVISVGGDGTFNTLLQHLAHTETTFLVVPAGTANDLARELGITTKLKKAMECIRRDEIHRIDLLSINGRFMATNGGIGVVSDVALNVNRLRRKIPGFKSLMSSLHHKVYAAALAGNLLSRRYRYYKLSIESPEFCGTVQTPLMFINNQPYIAGSFPIAPRTNNTDGTFNVTIFKHEKWTDFVWAVYRVKKNFPLDHDPNVISFETDRVIIENLFPEDSKMSFFGDGELLSTHQQFEVKILPKALKVFRLSIPCFKSPGEFMNVHGGGED